MHAGVEVAKRGARVTIEAGERGGFGREVSAVPAGVGDKQDDNLDSTVPLLAVQPTLEGLEVVENGFGFDRDPPIVTLDEQVPRSQVSEDRQRHLGSTSETRVEVRPQPIQEALLTSVTNGIAGSSLRRPERNERRG